MKREIEQIKLDLWTVKNYLKDLNESNKKGSERESMVTSL